MIVVNTMSDRADLAGESTGVRYRCSLQSLETMESYHRKNGVAAVKLRHVGYCAMCGWRCSSADEIAASEKLIIYTHVYG